MVATRSTRIKAEPRSHTPPAASAMAPAEPVRPAAAAAGPTAAASTSRKRSSTSQTQRKAEQALAAQAKRAGASTAVGEIARGKHSADKGKGRAVGAATAPGREPRPAGQPSQSTEQNATHDAQTDVSISAISPPTLQQISNLMDTKLNTLFEESIRPELAAVRHDQRALYSILSGLNRSVAAVTTMSLGSDVGHAVAKELPGLLEPLHRRMKKNQDLVAASMEGIKRQVKNIHLSHDTVFRNATEIIRRTHEITEDISLVKESCDQTLARVHGDSERMGELYSMAGKTQRTVDAVQAQLASAGPSGLDMTRMNSKLQDLRECVAGIADMMTRSGRFTLVQADLDLDEAIDEQVDLFVATVRSEAAEHVAKRRETREARREVGVAEGAAMQLLNAPIRNEKKRKDSARRAHAERNQEPELADRSRRRVMDWAETVR